MIILYSAGAMEWRPEGTYESEEAALQAVREMYDIEGTDEEVREQLDECELKLEHVPDISPSHKTITFELAKSLFHGATDYQYLGKEDEERTDDGIRAILRNINYKNGRAGETEGGAGAPQGQA